MTSPVAPRLLAPRTSWSDSSLVRACLEGNEEAWRALLAKYKNLIYSFPIKYGLSAEDAADIFQAVSMELLKQLPRLREPDALAGWLIKVTAHKCFQYRRREDRYVEGLDEGREISDPQPSLDDLFTEVQREQLIREAVLSLSGRCRDLVRALFFELPPRPYREVARELGLARGSIGFIRRRCLDRLRRRLEEKGLERP